MDALLNPATVQVAGIVIVALALAQVCVLLLGSLRRLSFERRRQALNLAMLREEVLLATMRRGLERKRTQLTWSGQRKLRVQRKVTECDNVCSFYLVPHDGKPLPPFQPGQYLTFHLKLPGRERPLIRCYSLSESPLRSEHYRMTIKRLAPPPGSTGVPPGLSSTFFHEHVHVGSIVDVAAPAGKFVLDLSQHTPVVLIAGGIGLTPLLCMLNAACNSGSKREVWLFYGVHHGGERVMREHLESLEREYENVHLCICHSDPREDEVEGRDYHHRGQVSVDLLKQVLPSLNYDFYVCGPGPMMESIIGALKESGVPGSRVHTEAFGSSSVKKTKAGPPAEAETERINVAFARSGKTLRWDPQADSLLDFAEANGVVIDSGCRAGSCRTCMTAVIAGEVSYLNEPDAQPEAGSCLTCISVPKTDLTLDA